MNSPHADARPSSEPDWTRWLLANSITLLRLVAGLVYPFVGQPLRLWLLGYAAFSDLIDGWISRRLHATSLTGQVLDPIADKVCVVAVLIMAVIDRQVTLPELLLVAFRDYTVALTALVAGITRPGSWRSMPPRVLGKLATAGQFVFLLNVIVIPPRWPGVLTIAGVLSVVAGVDYFLAALRYFRRTRTD